MLKGYSSSGQLERLASMFATIEPIRLQQWGLSVVAHQFVRNIGADAVEANSTVSIILAAAHAAQKGDVIQFTSGNLSGQEVKVFAVTADSIILAEDLPQAPAAADTFEINRHKYPAVDALGGLVVNTIAGGAATEATLAAMSAKLPATLGQKTMANSLAVVVASDQSAIPVSQSGTWNVNNISGTIALPTGAATAARQDTGNTSLGNIDGKLPATLGQKAMAASLAVVLASDQSAIPVSQSGTWNVNNISGTIALPTGAATEATLAAASAKLPATLGQQAMAASLAVVLASDQSAIPVTQSGTWNVTNISGTVSLPTGAATETTLTAMSAKLPAALGQTTMAASLSVAIASNQSAIPASQSGTWSSRTQDGSGNAVTSAALGSSRGLHVSQLGLTAVDKARNDYTSVNVTTGAYTQLVASLAAECQQVEIFDSSGQTLFLATGGAGAESDKVYIVPGGNKIIPLRIASGTRVAIKAVSGMANAGEISVNFYG